MKVIDLHTHVVPEHFPKYSGPAPDPGWPCMAHDGCGHAHVMISGKNFRTIGDVAWNTDKRATDMESMGVTRQVLSPMPELLSYWLPTSAAQPLLRHINEEIARTVAQDRSRFSGLGAVPLQDTDLAIRELEYLMGTLGLSGVEIAPNVNGVPIGDARFDAFFSAAERLGAAVFMHALRPAGKDRLIGPPLLEQVVAFPGEVGLGIASMMTGGMLERHADLRLAVSHGGGSFGLLLARMHDAWQKLTPMKEAMPQSPRHYARQLYYDTCVFDPTVLKFLIECFGDDRLIIGTDYPFGNHERDPLGLLERAGISGQVLERLCHENAERFLKIDS